MTSLFGVTALVTALIVLLERLYPAQSQPFFRKGLSRDLVYCYLNVAVTAAFFGLIQRTYYYFGWAVVQPPLDMHRQLFLLQLLVYILATDFIRYVTHYALHRFAFLWRFHRLHHRVQLLDWAATFRFHPVESLVDWLPMSLLLLTVSFSPGVVTLGYGFGLFWAELSHANLQVVPPESIFISPRMHRQHHFPSSKTPELGDNFGVIFSFWDRGFGTLSRSTDLKKPAQETGDTEAAWDEIMGV